MKIYFTASTAIDSDLTHNYQSILSLVSTSHDIVSGKQIVSRAQLTHEQQKGSEYIFSREKKRIDSADVVIAEVTKPSTGVGGEIVYALLSEKPVLALFYKDSEDMLTPMIAGNPSENLYLEHYTKDNLSIIIRNFLTHVKKQKTRKGKLIVLDGGDGSGKTTQVKLLVDQLKAQGIKAKHLSFPRYYSSFHGQFVGRYLRGEFGDIGSVSPYMAALAYALDRASAREEIESYLASGGYVICDRYVTSSMAHLSANLPEKERKAFIEWVDELEYRQHKMPRPDLVVYLYVPWEVGQKLTEQAAGERRYSKKADIHEKSKTHRQEAEKMYLSLVDSRKGWVKIECVKDSKLMSIKRIQEEIQSVLRSTRILG